MTPLDYVLFFETEVFHPAEDVFHRADPQFVCGLRR